MLLVWFQYHQKYLEESVIDRFKADSKYSEGKELSTEKKWLKRITKKSSKEQNLRLKLCNHQNLWESQL